MGIYFEVYRKLVYDNDGRPVIGATSRIENIIDDFGDKIKAEIKPTAKLYSTKTLSVNPTFIANIRKKKS
jgi:predicted DNA-binding ArsR family transcriptional regulator